MSDAPTPPERDALIAALTALAVFDGPADEKDKLIEALASDIESRYRADAGRIFELKQQRRLLARLASPEPQFFNPLIAMEAVTIRDAVLRGNEP